MRRYLLALSVTLAVLLAPSLAYADDGFIGGLQDLVGTREVEQQTGSPEQEYLEEYEPVYSPLRAGDEAEIEEGSEIQSVVNAANTVNWANSGGETTLLGSIRRLFLNTPLKPVILGAAAGLVFFWWGLRKSLRIIMSAFRSGRMSLGGREWNRNSYYYGTKPSDWR